MHDSSLRTNRQTVNVNRIKPPVFPDIMSVLGDHSNSSSGFTMASSMSSTTTEAPSTPGMQETDQSFLLLLQQEQDQDAESQSSSSKTLFGQHSAKAGHFVRFLSAHARLFSRRFSSMLNGRFALIILTALVMILLLLIRESLFSISQAMTSTPSTYSASRHSSHDIAAVGLEARGHHIPPQIWQVMFTPFRAATGGYDFDESMLPYTASWLAKNPDYRYTVIGTEGANQFVMSHFGNEERVLRTHFGLRNHGPRSDLMRYLIMLAEGGVYSDTDVTCLWPVDTWIPREWRKDVKAIVGIEGDSLGGNVVGGMIWDVQFGQWTVAAVPGHRLFRRMLDQMLDRLDDLVRMKDTTIDQLEMTALEIMNTTAPAGWSECVFAELQEIDPSLKEPKDLSGMKTPRLYGDIMVLPIDGFGMGVPHSGSTHDGTIPDMALVQHHFHGSWRETDGIEH